MRNDLFKSPIRLSRRNALLAGGGLAAAATAAGLAVALTGRQRDISFLAGVDLAGARALGDGFYEVDGWVLTAEDVKRLSGSAPLSP